MGNSLYRTDHSDEIQEEKHAAIAPRDGVDRRTEEANLIVVEDSERRITVAAFAGDTYTRTTEVAQVTLEKDSSTSLPVADVTQFQESDLAKRSGTRDAALRQAEILAKQRGIELLRFRRSEQQLRDMTSEERVAIVRDLQRDGYMVRYHTRFRNGSHGFFPELGQSIDPETVEGDPETIDALKDLTTARLEPPAQEIRLARDSSERFLGELRAAHDQPDPPGEILPPEQVTQGLDKLWDKSVKKSLFEREVVREYGAIIIEDKAKVLVLANEVKGNEGSVNIVLKEDGENVGIVHTHPYAEGLTNMPFSGQDYSSFMAIPEAQVSMVQSGDQVYMLAKTGDTPQVTTDTDFKLIKNTIDGEFTAKMQEAAAERPGGLPTSQDIQRACLEANLYASAKYHLCLYSGQVGKPLQRIYP